MYSDLTLFSKDIEAPKLDTCKSFSVKNALKDPAIMVNWTVPIATDNSGVPPMVTCVPTPGYNFPIGLTVVQCTAMDNSGNAATCSFDIVIAGMYVVKWL